MVVKKKQGFVAKIFSPAKLRKRAQALTSLYNVVD
jgi:hypothetical protein